MEEYDIKLPDPDYDYTEQKQMYQDAYDDYMVHKLQEERLDEEDETN